MSRRMTVREVVEAMTSPQNDEARRAEQESLDRDQRPEPPNAA